MRSACLSLAKLGLGLAAALAFAVLASFAVQRAHAAGTGFPVSLTSSGRIGRLRIDVSTREDVIAFAGTPEAEGENSASAPLLGWDALGYSCGKADPRGAFLAPLGGGPPYLFCRTVYYLSAETGRLATFATNERRFRTTTGIDVGMRTAAASRRAKRPAYAGCTQSITLQTPQAHLAMAISGAHTAMRGHQLFAIGGRVAEFVLESRNTYLDVFDCL